MKMKILNKKGFFMTETLVVIVFVAAIFTFLYISILPLVGTYNDKTTRESDIDIVYKLYHIRKMIYKDGNRENITGNDFKEIKCTDLDNTESCNTLMNYLELNNYTLLYVDGIKNNINKLNVSIYNEIYKTLTNSLEEEDAVLILYDNERNTSTYLKYDDSIHGGIAYKLVEKEIEKHKTSSCPIIYEEDGIKYFSGTNDCINFNYVWYSGKLWRITAIYPDGAMKLVTQNIITAIAFSEAGNVSFENSYAYQWLNEDFYDTLYNASEFIDTTKKWNATNSNVASTSSISTKLSETTMVSANVGLLNSYEHYNSYRCISNTACTGSSYSTGYLNIGYFWWLLNHFNSSLVWGVGRYGSGGNFHPIDALGGRPSIYLKSGLKFTGSGTKDEPYKIVGDKDTGKTNDLVNTRISGEYIKLVNNDSNQIFRIIGVEDGKTKIIAMNYADNKGTRKFATDTNTLWGSGTTINTDTWYDYLNKVNSDIESTGYYDKLVRTYGELFTSGTYYLGTSGNNYKLSVCANTRSGSIKNCIENSQVGTHDTFNIGLPRYGEMFATQQAGGDSNSIDMWLINRYSTSLVWYVSSGGSGSDFMPYSVFGGRPTLHLKSTVKIKSGTGTENDPYVVGL